MGTTISFAGKPSIKAISITPSKPIILAAGSKKSVQTVRSEYPSTVIFAINQIIAPAGAATAAARLNTNSVLSNTARIKTLPTCGILYGGISSVKEEGIPFNKVEDSNFVTISVMKMPNITTAVNKRVEYTPLNIPPAVPIRNIEIIAMIVGNAQQHKLQHLI